MNLLARQLNENGTAALTCNAGYLQAGYNLLSPALAARWRQNSLMRWRAITISIADEAPTGP